MKTIAIRYISRFLLFMFAVLMATMFFSCAVSKNKQKEKEEIKVEVKSDVKEETKSETKTETKTENQTKSENSTSETNVSYEGEKGDTLTVIEENLSTGEKKKTTFIGSGKFKKGNKASEEKNSGVSIQKTNVQNKTTNNKASKQEAALNSNKKKGGLQKKTTFSWWWLLLLLIPFFYLNKRFKWFIKTSNYVTKLFNK